MLRSKEQFENLVGKIIVSVEEKLGYDQVEDYSYNSTYLIIETSEGDIYNMGVELDCYFCDQQVELDIEGSWSDIIGVPILIAERVTNETDKFGRKELEKESFTWTFYKLATINGYMTISWLGTSNGYYSEEAEFKKIN